MKCFLLHPVPHSEPLTSIYICFTILPFQFEYWEASPPVEFNLPQFLMLILEICKSTVRRFCCLNFSCVCSESTVLSVLKKSNIWLLARGPNWSAPASCASLHALPTSPMYLHGLSEQIKVSVPLCMHCYQHSMSKHVWKFELMWQLRNSSDSKRCSSSRRGWWQHWKHMEAAQLVRERRRGRMLHSPSSPLSITVVS